MNRILLGLNNNMALKLRKIDAWNLKNLVKVSTEHNRII